MGVTRFAPGDGLATRDDSGWHSLLPDGLAPMPLEEVRRAERRTDEVVSHSPGMDCFDNGAQRSVALQEGACVIAHIE